MLRKNEEILAQFVIMFQTCSHQHSLFIALFVDDDDVVFAIRDEDRNLSFFDFAFVYMFDIASLLLMTIAIKR